MRDLVLAPRRPGRKSKRSQDRQGVHCRRPTARPRALSLRLHPVTQLRRAPASNNPHSAAKPNLSAPSFNPAHMGKRKSIGSYQCGIVTLQFLLRYPRSEPNQKDSARFRARSNSHSVAVRDGCTNIPLAAGKAQKDETLLQIGCSSHTGFRFVHLDPPRLLRSWKIAEFGSPYCQAFLITAPSMTMPVVTYFQSATSSFRASATIVVLRRRPPLRLTRSWNQRASAESG